MKKIFFTVVFFTCLYSCNKAVKQHNRVTNGNENASAVNGSICTGNEFVWAASPVNKTGFEKVPPAELFDSSTDGEIKIIKAIFRKDSSFECTLYKNAGAEWIHTAGTFQTKKDSAGRSILITHATKGFCSNHENGSDRHTVIPKTILTTNYCNQYLFEKICFNGIEGADFLLLVNMDKHPGIENNAPIKTSWVSKFYCRKK